MKYKCGTDERRQFAKNAMPHVCTQTVSARGATGRGKLMASYRYRFTCDDLLSPRPNREGFSGFSVSFESLRAWACSQVRNRDYPSRVK